MNEEYFENLANGKAKATDGEAELTEEEQEEGTFEVELAKANTSAVVSRSAKNTRAKNDWDEEPEGQLTVDVYQTQDDIVVESAIAGVRPEDIDINVTND